MSRNFSVTNVKKDISTIGTAIMCEFLGSKILLIINAAIAKVVWSCFYLNGSIADFSIHYILITTRV